MHDKPGEQCNEHEFGQTPEDGEEQGGLVCYSPWNHKELDMTERLNNNFLMHAVRVFPP